MSSDRTSRRVEFWLGVGGAAAPPATGVALEARPAAGGGWSLLAGVDAQEGPPEAAGVTVIGDGVVLAQPDAATLRLGVEVNAQTPAAALGQTREATGSCS
jgi:uncharacterized protein YggE